jgi:hypothetical protein
MMAKNVKSHVLLYEKQTIPLERSQKLYIRQLSKFYVFRILFRVFNAKTYGNDQSVVQS